MGTGIGEFHHRKGLEVRRNVAYLFGKEKSCLVVTF